MFGIRLRKKNKVSKSIKKATKARTNSASAEITRLKGMGISKIEFSSTIGCSPTCDALNGTVYTMRKAKGVIPVHGDCTCTWLPIIP